MTETRSAHDRSARLNLVAADAVDCTRCDLYRRATQTVFGRGPVTAPLMLVGEQPGDKEDRAGEPFVGPAGEILTRALGDVGIDQDAVYVTNVVKHFKWERSGKVRLHKKPNADEVRACHPWLAREIELVEPELVVLLGATAAQSMLGKSFRLTKSRGQLVDWEYPPKAMATIHPSAVLRAGSGREDAYRGLAADLLVAKSVAFG